MITRGRNLRKIEWKNILSSIVQMLGTIKSENNGRTNNGPTQKFVFGLAALALAGHDV